MAKNLARCSLLPYLSKFSKPGISVTPPLSKTLYTVVSDVKFGAYRSK